MISKEFWYKYLEKLKNVAQVKSIFQFYGLMDNKELKLYCKKMLSNGDRMNEYLQSFKDDVDSLINKKSMNERFAYNENGFNEAYDFLCENKEKIESCTLIEYDCQLLYVFFLCYILQIIWCVNNTFVINKNAKEIISMLDEKINDGSGKFHDRLIYYRGQNNSTYDLIPSFYRTLKNDVLVNNKYIEDQYKKGILSLMDRYNILFENNRFDYNFYAYMQHSICYSPFIDLTRSISIASMFALQSDKYPDVLDNDRALFEFNQFSVISKNNVEPLSFNVQYIKEKIKLNSIIFGNHLWELKLSDFESKFSLYKDEANDRMKIQKGLLLCLEKGVIVKNSMLIYTKDFWITKYIINKVDIEKIYNHIIIKYPQYKYEYLMNPYLFVNRIIEQ